MRRNGDWVDVGVVDIMREHLRGANELVVVRVVVEVHVHVHVAHVHVHVVIIKEEDIILIGIVIQLCVVEGVNNGVDVVVLLVGEANGVFLI